MDYEGDRGESIKENVPKEEEVNGKQNKLHELKIEISFHCLAVEVYSVVMQFSSNCRMSDNMSEWIIPLNGQC